MPSVRSPPPAAAPLRRGSGGEVIDVGGNPFAPPSPSPHARFRAPDVGAPATAAAKPAPRGLLLPGGARRPPRAGRDAEDEGEGEGEGHAEDQDENRENLFAARARGKALAPTAFDEVLAPPPPVPPRAAPTQAAPPAFAPDAEEERGLAKRAARPAASSAGGRLPVYEAPARAAAHHRHAFAGKPSAEQLTTRVWELEGDVAALESRARRAAETEAALAEQLQAAQGAAQAAEAERDEARRRAAEAQQASAALEARVQELERGLAAERDAAAARAAALEAQLAEAAAASSGAGARAQALQEELDAVRTAASGALRQFEEKLAAAQDFARGEIAAAGARAEAAEARLREAEAAARRDADKAASQLQDLRGKLDAAEAKLRSEAPGSSVLVRASAAAAAPGAGSSRGALQVRQKRAVPPPAPPAEPEWAGDVAGLDGDGDAGFGVRPPAAGLARRSVAAPASARNQPQAEEAEEPAAGAMHGRVSKLERQNELLRTALWREREERFSEKRCFDAHMELAQQRADEAVARALNLSRTGTETALVVRPPGMASARPAAHAPAWAPAPAGAPRSRSAPRQRALPAVAPSTAFVPAYAWGEAPYLATGRWAAAPGSVRSSVEPALAFSFARPTLSSLAKSSSP